jgi:hypothetical protein
MHTAVDLTASDPDNTCLQVQHFLLFCFKQAALHLRQVTVGARWLLETQCPGWDATSAWQHAVMSQKLCGHISGHCGCSRALLHGTYSSHCIWEAASCLPMSLQLGVTYLLASSQHRARHVFVKPFNLGIYGKWFITVVTIPGDHQPLFDSRAGTWT